MILMSTHNIGLYPFDVKSVIDEKYFLIDPHSDKGVDMYYVLIQLSRYIHMLSVIFLAIKQTPVTGVVPKAKKYVFFPIEANKFPK